MADRAAELRKMIADHAMVLAVIDQQRKLRGNPNIGRCVEEHIMREHLAALAALEADRDLH